MTSPEIEHFLALYNERKAVPASEGEPKIHVDEIAAKVAKFYEKARNIIDYQEEHLLRKGAIERALQQGLLFRGKETEIAEALIKKIIRAGHLPNDTIPESKIVDVQRIIDGLLTILEHLKDNPDLSPGERSDLSNWLIRITTSAIEEELVPPVRDTLTSTLMYESIRRRLVLNGTSMSENDRDIQLFIAVQRALLKADDDQLYFHLLKFSYPNWNQLSGEEFRDVADELPSLKKNMDLHLNHRIGSAFFKLCNHFNTVYYLLGDVTFQLDYPTNDLRELFQNDEQLALHIRESYKERYKKAKKGLRRLAFLSIVSIFLSKVLIALAVEVPIDRYLTGHFSLANTIVNIIVPPLLMLIILSFIKLPSRKNWGLIMKEVRAVTHGNNGKEITLMIPKKQTPLTRTTSQILYTLVSLGILYGLVRVLTNFNFSVANVTVFILFTSLVAATGVKVANRSRDLSLEKEKHSVFSFIFDVLIIPFVSIGKVLLAGLAKFKPLVIIINFIDLPFNVLVEFIENLRGFIKTKKEELY